MKVGDYVKWDFKDLHDETVVMYGTVTGLTKDRVTLDTDIGIVSFPVDDGKVTPATKRARQKDKVKAVENKPETVKAVSKPTRRKVAKKTRTKKKVVKKKATVRKKRTGTKLEACNNLFLEMVVDGVMPSRKDTIAAFVDKLGMKANSASTYHAMVRDKFVGK